MPSRLSIVALTLIIAAAVAATAVGADSIRSGPSPARHMAAAHSAAAPAFPYHRFRGRVISASPAHHWLWMRTRSNQRVQIYTNHHTYWDDCGWGYMRNGYRLDVTAYRSHHRWMATHMQPWNGWMMGMP